jgi:hypothetical protein
MMGRDGKKAYMARSPSNPETETFIAVFIFRSHTTNIGSTANTRSVNPVRAACAYEVLVLILPERQCPFLNGFH